MDRDSKPVCVFSANRLNVFKSKQIPEGVTTFIKGVNLGDLIQDSIDFLKKIKWIGIAELEFKKDSRDDEFKLLEINPRLWSWTKLASLSQVNFPYNYVLTLLNENSNHHQNSSFYFKEDVYYLRVMSDLYTNTFKLINREHSVIEFFKQCYQRLKVIIQGKLVVERFESLRWLYCHLRQRKEYV